MEIVVGLRTEVKWILGGTSTAQLCSKFIILNLPSTRDIFEISSSHGFEHYDYGLLGYDAAQFGGRCLSIKLSGLTTHKTVFLADLTIKDLHVYTG
jgi:hypothetical protein